MKVLFVDDEPKVLQGIERTLFDLSDVDIDPEFSSSAEEALERLGHGRYDVVISDMRMPGMSGEELLGQVKARQPAVMRIVLTGYAEYDMAMRVVKQAHQFLSKPCTPQLLTEMLRRAASMRRLMQNEALVASVGSLDALPSAPSMWMELNRMLASNDVVIDAVVSLIRRDPAMSAKVLQLANSALFGARHPLSDPKVAVTRLGLRTIRGLVLAIGAFSNETMNAPAIDLEAMQRRSLRAATLAQELCEIPEQKDTAFTAALLAELGSVLIATYAQAAFVESMRDKSSREKADAEQLALGYTHAEAGAYLLGLWGLPDSVIDAVAHHHQPAEELRMLDAAASTFVACAIVDGEVDRLNDVPWYQSRRERIAPLTGG